MKKLAWMLLFAMLQGCCMVTKVSVSYEEYAVAMEFEELR